ncbi:MAG: ATP-binding protein [Gemmatimonadaceae bacterium]
MTRVRRDLGLYPVVAVMGARQVGKSTLARHLARERGMRYLTLDDRDVRAQALGDPEGLLASAGDAGAVIDEVQRAPDLLLAIKAVVDREQRPGSYLLTGSNQPRVSRSVADSLLGRVAYRTLRPLTLSEQRYDEGPPRWGWLFEADGAELQRRLAGAAEMSGDLPWRDVVATGGMPRAVAVARDDRLQLLDDYLRTFAGRDVRDVLDVEAPERFEAFLRLVAAWTGQELNASGIARDLGVAVTTVQRWVDALERSYLVTLVPPYSRNASQRVIKAPKLFMVDPALALAGAREADPTGFHLETLVANDLHVWRDDAPARGLYHWRLPSGQEVDFVLQQGRALVPVEIKTTDAAKRRDARHLATFLERHSTAKRGVLLSSDPEVRLLGDRIVAAPWWGVV